MLEQPLNALPAREMNLGKVICVSDVHSEKLPFLKSTTQLGLKVTFVTEQLENVLSPLMKNVSVAANVMVLILDDPESP
jgi:hypothetical protein